MPNKLSYTSIRKVLQDCAFDPRKPGPMAVIADSATPDYAINRAMEFMREATLPGSVMVRVNIKKAVGLLGLAMAEIDRLTPKPKTTLKKDLKQEGSKNEQGA